jgi:hypothetical protein
MELLYVLILVLVVHIALRVREHFIRIVHNLPIPSVEFYERLRALLLAGGKGLRAYVYEPRSEILIVVHKKMPRWVPEAPVRLIVARRRVCHPERFDPEAGRQRQAGERAYKVVPKRRLPSAEAGQLLERVDCAGSVKRALAEVVRMISQEPALAKARAFHLWTDVGRSGRYGTTFGVFEE